MTTSCSILFSSKYFYKTITIKSDLKKEKVTCNIKFRILVKEYDIGKMYDYILLRIFLCGKFHSDFLRIFHKFGISI